MIPFLLALALCQESPSALVERLRSEKIDERDEATRQLKKLGCEARPALERAAKDADHEVAWRARQLLERLALHDLVTSGLMKAVPEIHELLDAGDDKRLTDLFLNASARERRRNPYTDLKKNDLEALACPALRSAVTDVQRMDVCDAISRLHLRSGIPEITRLLGRSHDLRLKALVALGNLKAADSVPVIVRLLESDDALDRIGAVHALDSIGSRESIPQIIRLLKDEEFSVGRRLWTLSATWARKN